MVVLIRTSAKGSLVESRCVVVVERPTRAGAREQQQAAPVRREFAWLEADESGASDDAAPVSPTEW